jgi:hypothetical protein
MRSIWLFAARRKFCYAQNPGDMKPATSNVFDAQYPKVQHIFYESSGTDHEWQTWRRDLKNLLRVCSNPLLSLLPLAEGEFVVYHP